jgi:hypothetical protein
MQKTARPNVTAPVAGASAPEPGFWNLGPGGFHRNGYAVRE